MLDIIMFLLIVTVSFYASYKLVPIILDKLFGKRGK